MHRNIFNHIPSVRRRLPEGQPFSKSGVIGAAGNEGSVSNKTINQRHHIIFCCESQLRREVGAYTKELDFTNSANLMAKNIFTMVPFESLGRAISFAIALYASVFLGQIIYNLFFSPLRKYPGPRSAAVSRLFITNHLLRGTQVYWLRDLHKKYGHIVRVAPDQLSFTDERAWLDINGSTPAAKYGMPKDERLNDLVGGDTINPDSSKSRAEQKHTQMRKAFAPGLTKSALKQQNQLIQGHVNELMDVISERGCFGETPVDLVEMFNFVAYNIFSDLLLGESFDLFKNPTYVPWVHSIKGFAMATMRMGSLQHFAIARYVLAFIITRFGKKYRDAFMDVCFERFDARMARKSEHPDLMFFATAEKKRRGEQQLPIKDMRDFSPFLMLAGGETTPTLLSGLIFCLLNHPDKLSRLIDEVRTSFEGDQDITMEKVFGLEYLNVCIDETLRIYPPIAAGVERVVPKGGAPIAGHIVPGKTIVLVPTYATHHQPLNFTSAGEFIPERWLPDAGTEFLSDRKNACRAFSVGPHACFGQEYVPSSLVVSC
ncbi:hypothetical protein VTL71DRAFT_12405 [Oculimacula yallundae]|uniref:Cytochrome P450 n=1 Tax=Oculimacula yallundae TaxID=86028 RepID=A0ABR4CMZ0_9HELO